VTLCDLWAHATFLLMYRYPWKWLHFKAQAFLYRNDITTSMVACVSTLADQPLVRYLCIRYFWYDFSTLSILSCLDHTEIYIISLESLDVPLWFELSYASPGCVYLLFHPSISVYDGVWDLAPTTPYLRGYWGYGPFVNSLNDPTISTYVYYRYWWGFRCPFIVSTLFSLYTECVDMRMRRWTESFRRQASWCNASRYLPRANFPKLFLRLCVWAHSLRCILTVTRLPDLIKELINQRSRHRDLSGLVCCKGAP
jgi:hypothetical protein